ncbi:MAG: 6-phospho-beta-glucosidase [Coprobacillaceae bacterium]
MEEGIKIVTIGGGSSYTPELMEGFIKRYDELPIKEIWLVDIEEGQETNGAGGILKAFRTIPIILDIVEDMKELCPDAWLINFTNPSGMVTEAIIKHGGWKKCIGLCNVPVMAMMKEPKMLNKDTALIYQFAGLNHFHWHKVTDKHGNDVTDQIIDAMYEKDDSTPANIFNVDFIKEQLNQMHLLPCGYHRYYYLEDEMLTHGLEEYNGIGTRGQQVKETETELFELYKNPALDHKPEQLEKRGGAYYSDAACECINAIYNNKNIPMVVSTQNNGAIPDLPDDSIVEVTSYITGKGAMPIAWGKLESAERGWIQVMKAMEECTIKAAITGDYGLAIQSFLLNPLVKGGNCGKRVLDELLVAHEKHLPKFANKIQELKIAGIYPKDEVVCKLLKEEN